jgi:hypothetical protein
MIRFESTLHSNAEQIPFRLWQKRAVDAGGAV